MTAYKLAGFLKRPHSKQIIRLFAAFSTLYGFWFVYHMDIYIPWQTRIIRGIELTLLGHFGLWLATLNTRGKIRLVIATILLPSIIGIFFLWWNLHLAVAIGALGYMSWVMFQIIKGK
jgi:hypothetical protein